MAELLTILKALSDETRFRLVKLLLAHDYCVGALAKRLSVSEPAVSQHLKILRTAGIINGDKRGYYTHYYVDRELLRDAANKIIDLSGTVPVVENCHEHGHKSQPCCRKEGSSNGKM